MVEACSLIDTAALPQYKLPAPGCMHFNTVKRELTAGTKGRPVLALCDVRLHECIHTAAIIATSLSVQSVCILVLQTEGAYYGLGLMSDV